MELAGVRRMTPEMRREQTRQYLLDAAAAVFAARGFHAASIDEIAEAAGYTKGAVYSHFGGKDGLFRALVQQRQEAMLERFFAAGSEEAPTARLEAIGEVYRQLNPTEAEWLLWQEFLLYSMRDPELRRELEATNQGSFATLVDMIRQQYEQLGIDPPLSPEDAARMYTAIFDGIGRQRVVDPDVDDDLFGRIVGFLGDALASMGRSGRSPGTQTTSRRSAPRSTSAKGRAQPGD